jgi:hypothetical protein
MTRRNLFAAVAAVGVLAAVGCGPNKLNEVKQFDLGTEKAAQAFESPAQGAAQTVKVEVTSDNAVDVYVLLGVSSQAAIDMQEKDLKAKAAASKAGTKSETLTVQVPAGQAVAVWVGRSGVTQKASGTVKMTN